MGNKPDPRVVKTRRAIRDAFMHLVSEKGYDAVTVKDVAERAEINRSTFYAHYADKYDLTNMCLIEWFDVFIADLEEKSDQPIQDILKDSLLHILAYFLQNKEFYLPLLEGGQSSQNLSYVKAYLIDKFMILFDKFPPDESLASIPSEFIADFFCAAYLGIITQWLKNGQTNSPEDLTHHLIKLTLSILQ